MEKKKATKAEVAGALVAKALKRKSYQPHEVLKDMLAAADLTGYFEAAKRVIRDRYGDNALTFVRDGQDVLYVLDPEWEEGKAYVLEQSKRALTEGKHISQLLDWFANQYGNKGTVRNSRRYANNLVEELEALKEELADA